MKDKYKEIVIWYWLPCLIFVLFFTSCTYQVKDNGYEKEQNDVNIVNNNISNKDDLIKSFDHKTHVEAGTTCKICHTKAYKSTDAGMPNEKLCVFCHETVYKGQQVTEFYNREEWFVSYKATRAKYAKIKMSHMKHVSNGITCEDCHGNITNSVKISSENIAVKKTCFSCHKEWNTPEKCDTCHTEKIESTHPELWGSPKHNHCLQCHIPISDSNKCKDCHNTASCVSSVAPLRPFDLPHRRGMMCRPCHSAGNNSLKHADNMVMCKTCHKLPKD